MKKILFYMIVCIWSCTSTDEQNLPKDASPDKFPDANITNKEQCILNAVNDKEGLRICGQGKVYGDSTIVAWGIKNKMLWCGFFEEIEENLFEEKYIWQGNEDFIDTIKVIDLGYRIDTLMLLSQKEPYCLAYFSDKDTFALQLPYFPAIFIENKNIYINDQVIYNPWIKSYYITQKYSEYPIFSGRHITNCKGEKTYIINGYAYVDKNSIPVSVEDFISVTGHANTIWISRQSAKDRKISWTYTLDNIGHIVNEHYPTFREEHSINNDRIAFTFYITNYDGSKNTKSIEIDINKGSAIAD